MTSQKIKISKEDFLRLKLLLDLLDKYLNQKETYQDLPFKIKTILEMLTSINQEIIDSWEIFWGQLKLIQSIALYHDFETLSPPDSDDYNEVVLKFKNNVQELMNLIEAEEEDPYAWPY